ncbi:Hypothetical predicted protein [Marmota monax]|uniref:Uncharacterized protein n=1 Tax=Marmota monax TaxID=9995 RepID=A0A5E4CT71_MARMO|nr:Hypothetical predicted protein [Marmota monax]
MHLVLEVGPAPGLRGHGVPGSQQQEENGDVREQGSWALGAKSSRWQAVARGTVTLSFLSDQDIGSGWPEGQSSSVPGQSEGAPQDPGWLLPCCVCCSMSGSCLCPWPGFVHCGVFVLVSVASVCV